MNHSLHSLHRKSRLCVLSEALTSAASLVPGNLPGCITKPPRRFLFTPSG